MDALELKSKLYKDLPNTELAVENAIAIYRDASAKIDAFKEVQEAAKKLLEEIIIETGQSDWKTKAGNCKLTNSYTRVNWDSEALDSLCANDDNLARILTPHRKESEIAGTLRITK